MAPDLEQSIEVGAIFFDIKKAFNTVPHRPLLNKLSDMGLHPHILQWLGSYLQNRLQRVVVNAWSSLKLLTSSFGCPTRVGFGPFTFS